MGSYKILPILVIAAVASPVLGTFKENRKEEIIPSQGLDEVYTCGGVLTNYTDQILYKPFKEVNPNERCVWIVAVPQVSWYNVRVLHFGHDPSDRLVNIAGVYVTTGVPAMYYPETTDNLLIGANALVITFHSPGNGTTGGFALEYSVESNSTYISPHSENYVVDGALDFKKFPEGREQYDNYEMAIFALPPVNNVFVEGRSRQAVYARIELESCYDKVSVYDFDAGERKYVTRGSLCDDVSSELISNDDVSLIIFRSDSSITGRGFNLAFPTCEAAF